MEIRSYRAVFRLERRIYRIDRLRLNPAGVPVLGVVYFLAVLFAVVVVSRLPGVDTVAGVVPWYLREVAAPAGGAALMTMVRIDGRPFHLAARAMLTYAGSPRRVSGAGERLEAGSWRPEDLLVLPDGSDGRTRPLMYTGPGAVRVEVAHRLIEWRRWPAGLLGRADLTVEGMAGGRLARASLIELGPGGRMLVR